MGCGPVMTLSKQELAPPMGPTYDTRPMPEDGSKLWPVAALADERRQVELSVPVERLVRVAELLVERVGTVQGSVALAREQGRIVADVTLDARLTLRCQRCLGPMQVVIESSSRVALLESEEEAASVPSDLETALAPEGRLRLADLVEEELLLALPAAPRHAAGQCPAAPGAEESEEESVQRPFANLGELLAKRSKH
jgi:uncharacterized protein